MNTLKWTKEKPKIEDIGENLLLIADDYGNYYNYKLFIISKMDGDLYLCDHFGELWGDYEEDLNADMYAVIEKNKIIIMELKTPEEITQYVLDGMMGIGGCPNNEEFYAEFNDRLKRALSIAAVEQSEQLFCPYCGNKKDYIVSTDINSGTVCKNRLCKVNN